MPRDQNGNDIASTSEAEQKQNRINRNMAKFLSTERQQKQVLLCLSQRQVPKRPQLRIGRLTSTTVAYGHEAYLDHAVELLQHDLKPIPPQPNCQESMQVYEEHRLMAAEYLEVQKRLEDMRQYRQGLEDKLRQSEMEMEEVAATTDQEEVKKFIQLQKEKESLIKFRDQLATQLQLIKKASNQQGQEQNNLEATPPTTNLEEDWVLVHGAAAAPRNPEKS